MKICGIVAAYFGARRSNRSGYANLVEFSNAFSKYDQTFLSKLIIVISGSYDAKLFSDSIAALKNRQGLQIEVLERKNTGFSYGAWNDAVLKTLSTSESFTHYFLIEDDYRPNTHDYCLPFLQEDAAYTASLVGHHPKTHAAISNGILRADVAKKVANRYGSIFFIRDDYSSYNMSKYQLGEFNQLHFLDYIISFCRESDYLRPIADISSKCRIPFYCNGSIKFFGNSEGPTPIVCTT